MKINPDKKLASFKCAVCSRQCQYFCYGVKCCEACKQFFRRSISKMKEYKCKKGVECGVQKEALGHAMCKRCRMNKCISVGMNPRSVCGGIKSNNGEQMMAFLERMEQQILEQQQKSDGMLKQCKEQAAAQQRTAPSRGAASAAKGVALATQSTGGNCTAKWADSKSQMADKNFTGFLMLKQLLEIEQKVRRIRDSQTKIPEFFFDRCISFEALLEPKFNVIECSDKFSTKLPNKPPEIFAEMVRQKGVFFMRPPYLAMDLLFVFEIGKTFAFFQQLNNSDKVALCSSIAAPLLVLTNGFYSVQQNCDTFSTPNGLRPIALFGISHYKNDPTLMKLAEHVLCKATGPFIRTRMSTEEFVVVRAIIYAHMVSPGLSDQAQKLLFTEAEKFSSLLMRISQANYGPEAGARRFVQLLGLIEFAFNSGAKHRQMLTYLSCVLDTHFDSVMPPVLAKVCTKGPVELHQLFPHSQ